MDPSFIQNFINLDHWLFQQINSVWTSSILDAILPVLTDLNKNSYVPLVTGVLALLWILKARYRALMWITALVIAVGLSDFVSYRVIKSVAERNRPEQAGVHVILRTTHHSGSSFPSNHAANAFAGASILSGALPVGTPLWFFIAFLIAYSRVYVGVHFPIDVIGGAILGWTIGFMTKILLNQIIARADLSEKNRHERAELTAEKERRNNLMRRK